MKNFKFKMLGGIFAICIFLSGIIQITGANQMEGDYYIVEGQKISLQKSQKYSAIKLKPEYGAEKLKSFKADIVSMALGIVEDAPIFEKYGIVLIRLKEGTQPSTVQVAIQDLSKRKDVESENPVYANGGIDQVLVNEFIVQFKSNASEQRINQSIKGKNAKIVKKHEKIKNRYILTFPNKSARQALTISNEYNQDPLVEFSEPNFIRIYPQRSMIKEETITPQDIPPSPQATPGDPLYFNQWYLNNTGSVGKTDADIDAPETWNLNKGSSGVVIAIIDEGVQTNHPDLQNKIINPYDATDGDNNQEPNSWDGHGTACAGIAAAATNNNLGVAGIGWNVSILPVRIAYSAYKGASWTTMNTWIEDGIRTAVNRGAHVLSCSWGGGASSSAINSAIDYAISQNRIMVFAAGNDAGTVSYPANLSKGRAIVAVSATNEWDEFKTKTSKDGEYWWGSNFGSEVNIAAPGVHIYTTDITGSGGYNTSGDYYSNFDGTSSATPLVAGVAALILSQKPSLSPVDVRNQLQTTADDLGTPGFDNQFGYGRINAYRAASFIKIWVNGYGCDAGGWYVEEHPRIMADVNGDGKADVVGFGEFGVSVSLSTGTSFTAPTLWIDNFGHDAGGWRVGQHPRMMADVNGDGKADVVGFGEFGVSVSLSTGTSFSSATLWINNYGYKAGGWRVGQHPRIMADVNGDGKADVVGFGNAGVYVSFSTGTSFTSPALLTNNFGHDAGGWRVGQHPRMMADVNGDGKVDVVGFGEFGVSVSLSIGTSFTASTLWINEFGHSVGGWRVGQHPRMVADVNGDGKADVVGFGEFGVSVSLSTGKSFTASTLWINDYGYKAGGWHIEEHPRMMADVNGDGKADVVGFGNAGMLVSLSTGTNFTAQTLRINYYGYMAGEWRVEEHPRMMADINGDGKADVVGFGSTGVYVSLTE